MIVCLPVDKIYLTLIRDRWLILLHFHKKSQHHDSFYEITVHDKLNEEEATDQSPGSRADILPLFTLIS